MNRPQYKLKRTVKERFENFVMPEPNTGCWIWAGSCSMGYGMIGVKGKNVKASRLSYTMYKGEIPDGLIVCHHCDNTYCVNPDHLFLGTHQDNANDKMRKGRHNASKGENNPSSKLNNEIVLEILTLRGMGLGEVRIGKALGVSRWGVSKVMYGRSWTHISGIKPNKASELDKNQ